MRLLFALSLVFAFAVSARAEDSDSAYERSKYIAPAQLDGSHYLFDHNGRPTRARKDKEDKTEAKKKKKDKKRKKLAHKPRKRRPKGYGKKASDKKSKAPESETAAEDFPEEPTPSGENASSEPPDAEEAPSAPGGQGLDYGGVSLEDDQKVAIPGGSGAATEEPFSPAPPEAEAESDD